jgi:26S proteasome regulatory subunit N7
MSSPSKQQENTNKTLEEKLHDLEEKIKNSDSIEEFDVNTYVFERARLYKENNKTEEAIKEYKIVIEKTPSFNLKMDSVFEILLIAIRAKDINMIKENLDLCKKFLKDASDWEKKNKYKVYEGLYLILTRKFQEAGKLFLEALMTFVNYELFSYKDFVFYTAITNIITVDRVTLKNRVIDNSDVVSCIKDIPHLKEFLESFYTGNYKKFFVEFYHIIERIKKDFFLSQHSNYFISEMRIKVYNQFLRKYK